jgi:hypothetical protein
MSSDDTKQEGAVTKDGSNIQSPMEGWSPELDLANRYQSMVGIQFNSLSNFEDKAWRTIRATVSLIGIYLAGLSLLSKIGGTSLTIELADVVPILIGTGALLGTIYYAVLVLLGVKVGFGPSTDLSDTVNKDSVDDEGYSGILVEGYANTVTDNWEVLKKKSENLRRSLSLLIFGLVEVSLGFIFVIFTLAGIGGQTISPTMTCLKYGAWGIISLLIGVLVVVPMWSDDPDDANPDETDGNKENDKSTE